MAKYQKKPVVIEAFKWGEDLTPEWGAEAFVEGTLTEVDIGIGLELHIQTLEGEMVAEQGDFIIQGVHGEIYSCKPDIFKETYGRVGDVHIDKDKKIYEITWENTHNKPTTLNYSVQNLIDEVLENLDENLVKVTNHGYIGGEND